MRDDGVGCDWTAANRRGLYCSYMYMQQTLRISTGGASARSSTAGPAPTIKLDAQRDERGAGRAQAPVPGVQYYIGKDLATDPYVRAYVTYAATLLSLVRSAPPLPALTAAGRINAPNAPDAARLV